MASASGQVQATTPGPAAPTPNGAMDRIGAAPNVNGSDGVNGALSSRSSVSASASAAASPAMQPLDINKKSKSPPSHIISDLAGLKPSSAAPSPRILPQGAGTAGTQQGAGSSSPSVSTSSHVLPAGFPSPGGKVHGNRQFIQDRHRLSTSILDAMPEAVRRSVRDNWEKCLVGSDFHQAFILNASLHHASPQAIQRGMRDFGKNLVHAAKSQIIEQMSTADLDTITDLILSKASVAFFDRAFEQRLKTIPSKKLVNALARAERLGYEPDDVDDDDEGSPPAQAAANHLHQQARQQQQEAASASSRAPSAAIAATPPAAPSLHCGICFRRFTAQSAYDHHVKEKVCTRAPNTPGGFKYNCQHCGQGFTTPMGLLYHNSNKVCGDFGEPKANIPSKPHTPQTAATSIPSRPAAVQHKPVPSTTYLSSSPAVAGSPGTPGLVDKDGGTSDPYAHLSPEQLVAMQSELREAEVNFTERMRQVISSISDPAERKTKLDGLGNSHSTKQSLIRKKYGVRLRIRRGKAEIQQERSRIDYKTSTEMMAELLGADGMGHRPPGRPPSMGYAAYRATHSLGSANNSGASTSVGGSGSGSGSGGAWAAVNQSRSKELNNIKAKELSQAGLRGLPKRRLSGSSSPVPDAKRVATGVDAGGKAGADTGDRSLVAQRLSGAGTKDEPMALDGSSSEDENGSGSNSDDGSDADEDIPAVLPASVLQTLRSSSAGGGASRPGSSSAGVDSS